MPTLATMVAKVRQDLLSFSQAQQQYTSLAGNIGPTDLSYMVNDATQVNRGLIEVGGSELMYVDSINRQSNTVAILPSGRGWMGTTAASWTTNTLIENNPIFPYQRVVEAINDAINQVYPDLFAIGTTSFDKISVIYQYALPAAAEEVISVRYQIIGPSQITPWMRHWRFDGQADTTIFPSGKAITCLEEVTPGRLITVTYMQEPAPLVNGTDDFVTVTGLPSSASELITYGACAKLAPSLEGPRLLLQAAETSERSSMVQPGSAVKVSQYYAQLYQERLQEERRKLYDRIERPEHFNS